MEYQWFEELPPSCPPLKLPKFKHANIAVVSLRPMDGKIKKTFKNSHYSWWRSKAFDIKNAKTITIVR